jgi:hypothetical protein
MAIFLNRALGGGETEIASRIGQSTFNNSDQVAQNFSGGLGLAAIRDAGATSQRVQETLGLLVSQKSHRAFWSSVTWLFPFDCPYATRNIGLHGISNRQRSSRKSSRYGYEEARRGVTSAGEMSVKSWIGGRNRKICDDRSSSVGQVSMLARV